MKKFLIILLTALTLTLMSSSAFASITANSNMTVFANVTGTCNISAGALNFGTYTSGQVTDLEATAIMTVNCSNLTAYSVVLDGGGYYLGGYWRMANGPSYLQYSLYRDIAETILWPVAAVGYSGTGIGAEQPIIVFGRVLANQTIAIGPYVDIVVATVTW